MAGGKKKKGKNPSLQKEIFLQVFNQLSNNMEWLKSHVGEKKWGNLIRKASKLLSEPVKEKKGKKVKSTKGKKVKSTKGKAVKKSEPASTPTPTAEQLP